MRNLDRAMYAICLLALLADVARSQVPLSVGGDATAGLMVRAAGQLRADALLRAEALPAAELLNFANGRFGQHFQHRLSHGLKPADVSLLLLTRILAWPDSGWQRSGSQLDESAGMGFLAAGRAASSGLGLSSGGGPWDDSRVEVAALAPVNFEHFGSAAP